MFTTNGISVKIGAHALLDNFTAQFAAAELVAVVGPNGAGKTTLLRCLNGELTPTDGEIEFSQRPLDAWPRDELARMRAVLPQQSHLNFSFSVNDVVLMGRMPHTTSDAENRAIAMEVLELCDCAQFISRDYTSLSGGEQRRVQIARALAQIWKLPASKSNTNSVERFLLLDEPLAALDLSHQYAVMRVLQNLRSEHKIGIVCVLHNLNLVAQFADRSIVMERGMMVADGTPLDVFTEETLSNVFNLDISVHEHPENASIPLLIPRLNAAEPNPFPVAVADK